MPRKHSLSGAIGFLSLLLTVHLEARPDRDIIREARRHYLVEHIRIAATDRLIERPDEIAAYLDANFNTVVLYDTVDNGPLTERPPSRSRFRRPASRFLMPRSASDSVYGTATETT